VRVPVSCRSPRAKPRNQDRAELGRRVRPNSRAFKAQVFKVTKLLGWRISEEEPFLR
jgi:hypothetical protein